MRKDVPGVSSPEMTKPVVPFAPAAARDVVTQKGERRMAEQRDETRSAAVLVHLAGGVRRVAVDGLDVVGDAAVRVVLQLPAEGADRTVDLDPFVDVAAYPARPATIVQAELMIGVPVGRPDPAPEVP